MRNFLAKMKVCARKFAKFFSRFDFNPFQIQLPTSLKGIEDRGTYGRDMRWAADAFTLIQFRGKEDENAGKRFSSSLFCNYYESRRKKDEFLLHFLSHFEVKNF